MDRRPPNRKPVDNSDLAELPMNTLAKSMRAVEDIMADYIAGNKLSGEEEGLLDMKLREKTGKHLDKFKDKPQDARPILSVESGFKNKKEARDDGTKKKAPRVSESVS